MNSVLPRQPPVDHAPRERVQLSVTGEESATICELLSSTTARQIVAALKEGPKPASEIATAVGTSLQNTSYHLDRLVEGDLVEPTETWYSKKGREMTVYALRTHEVVIRF
ncbi:Helix-turn-helix domain-containing protein [Halorubrum xinjiangense]|uniref:Helix-turn-helix domain-containing protein n=1 Tax=Halorubrum xinjiangense TaxID=261291 RepID=A0A1G7M1B4_9EURY|nr:winged helix-turn-helix domain-containing protein [Halorubrum xinjiangense]SDF55463.1 Helix-turn-helix domain-containing protein [Halorubrum xinjiangense]